MRRGYAGGTVAPAVVATAGLLGACSDPPEPYTVTLSGTGPETTAVTIPAGMVEFEQNQTCDREGILHWEIQGTMHAGDLACGGDYGIMNSVTGFQPSSEAQAHDIVVTADPTTSWTLTFTFRGERTAEL